MSCARPERQCTGAAAQLHRLALMNRCGRSTPAAQKPNAPQDLRGVLLSLMEPLYLDQRHLRHRAPAGRRRATLRAWLTRLARSRAPLRAVFARLRQLLLLRSDRPLRVLEAQLV